MKNKIEKRKKQTYLLPMRTINIRTCFYELFVLLHDLTGVINLLLQQGSLLW